MGILSSRRLRLRTCLLVAILALAAVSAPRAQSSAAPRRARLSADLSWLLTKASAGRTRVLVDGSRASLTNVVARHRVAVVRWLDNGAVLALNAQELADLSLDPAVDHLSGDLPVRPSMVVSNVATLADKTRAGGGGLLGLGAVPGVTGAGIVVAVVDSGIAPHPALAGKVVANVSLVTGDPRVTDVVRPRHARRGHHRGHGARRSASHDALQRRHRAGRSADERARARCRRHRLHERCDCRHRLGHRQPRPLQHPRHQPVARPPGDRAGAHRPAVPGGRARQRARASSSSPRPATMA